MQNQLKNITVLKLIYCYVNMWLLKKNQKACSTVVSNKSNTQAQESDYVAYKEDDADEVLALDSFLMQSILEN